MKQYTFCIKNITGNGIVCTNPEIVWIKGSAQAQPCKDRNGCITITVPDGISGCIKGEVICKQCGPEASKPFEICPCTTNADCPGCNTCIDNICVNQCNDTELCINDQCVCPPDKPFKDPNGNCVQCNNFTNLPFCQVCVDYVIVPRSCPGRCDEDQRKCVDCLLNSDCASRTDGKNCCSENGQCECCPGFQFNPALNRCEPLTDCTRNGDCPKCSHCVGGICQPIICPAGYVCVDGECKKICNCNAPDCASIAACVPLNPTTCYCNECSGGCSDNSFCPNGCICQNGTCVPNPCDRPCDPFNPCPSGCGCLNGRCHPCSQLSCNNCTIPGCYCPSGTCIETPCQGPCDKDNLCSPGCGCDNNTCKPCDKPCVLQEDCALGCYCDEKIGRCKANPCQYKTCESPSDCGRDCTCYNGRCVPCSAFDCAECASVPGCSCNSSNLCQRSVDPPCNDILTLNNDTCNLYATLIKTDCCTCDDVFLHIQHSYNGVAKTHSATGFLRNGGSTSSTLLGSMGISNNLPTEGTVEVQILYNTILTRDNSLHTLYGTSINLDFVNTDTSPIDTAQAFGIGDNISIGVDNYTVLSVCFRAVGAQVFKFPNECKYSMGDKSLACTTNNSLNFDNLTNLSNLVNCRTPLFIWYKDNFSTPFRQEYGFRVSSNTYRSILDQSEGVELCHTYMVDADCKCSNERPVFSCNNDDIATNYVIYQPEDITVIQGNSCNTQITIEEVSVQCDILIGEQYTLYLNDVDVTALYSSALTVDSNKKLFTGDLTISHSEPIRSIRLCYPCDDCNKCITKTPIISTDCFLCANATASLNVSGDCILGLTASGNISQTIPSAPIPGCNIDLYVNNVWTTTVVSDALGNFLYLYPVSSPGNYTFKAVFDCANDCFLEDVIAVTNCCDFNFPNPTYDCGMSVLTSAVTGCSGPLTYQLIDLNDNSTISAGLWSGSLAVSLPNGVNRYKLSMLCNGVCTKDKTFSVGCALPDFIGSVVCDSGNPKIKLESFVNTLFPATANVWVLNSIGIPSGLPNFTVTVNTPTPPLHFDPSLTINKHVYINIVDGLGNESATEYAGQVQDCNIPCFDIQSTTISCDPGTQNKRVCVRVNATGTYNIELLNSSNLVVMNQPGIALSAGVETCVPPVGINHSPGSYTVRITDVANPSCIKTRSVIISDCQSYSISYNCTTGLTILEGGLPYSGFFRVDNAPNSGYYSYPIPGGTYMSDGNHVVDIYNGSGGLVSTLNINVSCCNIAVDTAIPICIPGGSPEDGRIDYTFTGASLPINLDILFYDSSFNILDSVSGQNTLNYSSPDIFDGTYTIRVIDANIPIPNVGNGPYTNCQEEVSTVLSCSGTCASDLFGSIGIVYQRDPQTTCANVFDLTKSKVIVLNTSTFNIDADVYVATTTPGSCPSIPTGYTFVSTITNIAPSTSKCISVPAHGSGQETCVYATIRKSDGTCPEDKNIGPVNTNS